MKKKLPYFAVIVVVFVLDRFTKHLIVKNVGPLESIPVLEGFFDIVHIKNTGGAFGLFSDMPPFFRTVVFLALPAAALVFFFTYLLIGSQTYRTSIALSLITGGAAGNLTDRILSGSVVDFLDVHWYDLYHWPAFNVADSAISIGAAIFILDILFPMEDKSKDVS